MGRIRVIGSGNEYFSGAMMHMRQMIAGERDATAPMEFATCAFELGKHQRDDRFEVTILAGTSRLAEWSAPIDDSGHRDCCGNRAATCACPRRLGLPAIRSGSAHREIFGPVACVIRAKDYDEALALANDTPFGLCSGIVTTSLKHASHYKRHAQAGMVMVNVPTAGVDYHVPFGGRQGSSYGRANKGATRPSSLTFQ
jgi:hypothetical protein